MLRSTRSVGDPRASQAYQRVNPARVESQEMPVGHQSVPGLARPVDITAPYTISFMNPKLSTPDLFSGISSKSVL